MSRYFLPPSVPPTTTTVEYYRACYSVDPVSGTPKIQLIDDASTQNTLDCPYPPSLGSSVYPGQACFAGVNAYNDAITKGGLDPTDPDFPIPLCPGASDTINDDEYQIDSGGFPTPSPSSGGVIDCAHLTLQYMPNEDFSGCFPILQTTLPSTDNAPRKGIYYDSQSACQQACTFPSPSPNTFQNVSTTLTQKLDGSQSTRFCANLPLCGTPAISPLTTNFPYTTVQANVSCLQSTPTSTSSSNLRPGGGDEWSYRVLPPIDTTGCSRLYNILPTTTPAPTLT